MNAQLQTALDWILQRLSETSTWRGIVLSLTGMGIAISPSRAATITAVGLGVVGIINIIREGSPTKTQVNNALATKQDLPIAPTPGDSTAKPQS